VKLRKSHLIIALLGLAFIGGAFAVLGRPHRSAPPEPSQPSPVVFANPYDSPQQLMVGIYAAEKHEEPPPAERRIRALIVPHHLTATETIAAGIRMLRHQDFARVLLISPDHFDRCPTLLCTTGGTFQTVFGEVRTAPETLQALKSSPLVTDEPDLFKQEHGIYAILPYLAHERPGVPVTPLVISQTVPWKAERQALLEAVGRAVDETTLVIVSSDFSHYLPLDQAQAMDEATAEMLFAKDLDGVADLKVPAQSDCPNCLWTLASLADARGFYNPAVVMHTNSALILNDPAVKETTSHFSMAWYQNDALDSHDLAVAGDVTVTRGVPRPLSQPAQDWWAGDGPRFVNLEGPLAGECPPQSNPFRFCLLEKKWLRISGLATHWGLANNHMFDLGATGTLETERIIQAHGEIPVTATPWEDGKVRLLALTELMNPVDEISAANMSGARAAVLKSLQESKPDELTVVLVHGGTEYHALTSDAEEKLYEQLIDAGADAVVAVHSHVIGDVHFYHDKPIFRGVGNFLFDQYDRIPTTTAKLVRLRKENGRVLFETLTSR